MDKEKLEKELKKIFGKDFLYYKRGDIKVKKKPTNSQLRRVNKALFKYAWLRYGYSEGTYLFYGFRQIDHIRKWKRCWIISTYVANPDHISDEQMEKVVKKGLWHTPFNYID